MDKKLLFVQPDFPVPGKSINHSNFLPVALLKLITFYRGKGFYIDDSQLVKGECNDLDFYPEKIFITTLFTYWFSYVEKSILFYKNKYPSAEIFVGGILASLLPEKIKELDKNINVFKGIDNEVEEYVYKNGTNYDVVDKYGVDYIIVHAMRGCIRRCSFCGTWRIEERKDYTIEETINYIKKSSTSGEIIKTRVIFYDNNFLAHRNIEKLLEELSELKIGNRRYSYESQSGFDGRLLLENPYSGTLLKKTKFIRPKIAWDGQFSEFEKIKTQIDILVKAGYKSKEISVFILYNWEVKFEEVIKKLKKCWEWQVQINDCRFRPLNSIKDNYNPHMWRTGQTKKDYYIHEKSGWTDKKIRLFRKLVRQQNIMVRQIWSPEQFEQWKKHEKVTKDFKSIINWPEDYIKL